MLKFCLYLECFLKIKKNYNMKIVIEWVKDKFLYVLIKWVLF